jgi:hypothetical protein
MRKFALTGLVLLVTGAAIQAADIPEFPPPGKQHAWLQKFVGTWEADVEATVDPSQPPMKSKGTETSRMVGGFWLIAEGKNDAFPFSYVTTLGYDTGKQKYVGTWVDSMTDRLWTYEGSVDETGKILTMETAGPCPLVPGKIFKFREVTEFKSPDHRVFTSAIQGEDGKWTTILTVNSRRKK